MILEISFGLVGGINFGLEKSWDLIKGIIMKYPHATWTKIINKKKRLFPFVEPETIDL